MGEKTTFEIIYDIIYQIPEGKVATYGQIAALAGNKRWARVVGYALHAVPHGSDIPWHRVVKKNGEVFGGAESSGGMYQTELLAGEGVRCIDGYVDMEHYQWKKVLF
ncbi:MAG: MGMT family protein [Dorea sp.]|jgi:methylated-DNA-protein-cysteine methyltransferase-like protein|nr:MGMT family protein [Dorea sp.]